MTVNHASVNIHVGTSLYRYNVLLGNVTLSSLVHATGYLARTLRDLDSVHESSCIVALRDTRRHEFQSFLYFTVAKQQSARRFGTAVDRPKPPWQHSADVGRRPLRKFTLDAVGRHAASPSFSADARARAYPQRRTDPARTCNPR